ncbi:MAG TPA: hypothetical protein VHY19_09800 [Steroidobacteraceae bacterium]|jgi:hypothetical protein|nr:hypothetical protein [Steroidobacteraceae bacterium]
MSEQRDASDAAAEYRRHFDQFYLGVIPRILTEEGMFLAFVSMIAAIESLAGICMPDRGTGERFRAFIETYFPTAYESYTEQLWQFRNRMVHAFNPTPFIIVCHQSRMHLCDANGITILNAEDFYADLISASRAYFTALYADVALQTCFSRRLSLDDGGRPISHQVVESVTRGDEAP